MGGGGYARGWYLYGSDPYGRLPELKGIISRCIFIGWYSCRGSYSYRGSYRYPYCCGHSSQLVCKTCRARKTAKKWEGASRGSNRIERAHRVERVGRAKQTGGNSGGKWKDPCHNAQNRNAHPLPLCILRPHECPCACVGQVDTYVLR